MWRSDPMKGDTRRREQSGKTEMTTLNNINLKNTDI